MSGDVLRLDGRHRRRSWGINKKRKRNGIIFKRFFDLFFIVLRLWRRSSLFCSPESLTNAAAAAGRVLNVWHRSISEPTAGINKTSNFPLAGAAVSVYFSTSYKNNI